MVDGDRLLVLSQGIIVKMAERGSKGIYPLYYEMKKANAEIITNESLYEGLRLAFTGGNIGGISNNITKIWNSDEISQDAMDAVKWLCMETNFTIDYSKTLFKPTRPEYANEIISRYTKSKVPHFFVYAKDKNEKGVEPINDSMVNRISKTITTNKMMLKNLSKMDKVNKDYLLNYEDKEYENEEINKLFDLWNKKYGQNIKVDEENTDKNNITEIVKTIKNELHKIEPDDDKILTSIVNFLYKKESTRKKKLLWYIYGEEMYENLLLNIKCTTFCHICGKRYNSDELIHNVCKECLKKEEATKKKSGKKEVECVDCGVTITVDVNNKRTCRCTECQIEERKRLDRIRKSIDKNSTF